MQSVDGGRFRTLADFRGRRVGTLGGTIAYEILLRAERDHGPRGRGTRDPARDCEHGDTLFSVRPVPPAQGDAKLAAEARKQGQVVMYTSLNLKDSGFDVTVDPPSASVSAPTKIFTTPT